MNERLLLAGVAMHAMLAWRGEWEIDSKLGILTGDDRRLLSVASVDIADAMLHKLYNPQAEEHER